MLGGEKLRCRYHDGMKKQSRGESFATGTTMTFREAKKKSEKESRTKNKKGSFPNRKREDAKRKRVEINGWVGGGGGGAIKKDQEKRLEH